MNFKNFNKQQQEAITSEAPYIKVIAGAGSGKTAVLTNRIVNLIVNNNVPSRHILAITFTNKAAKEMKERILSLLKVDQFEGVISTFHSLCLRILKEDINLLGYQRNFSIIDSDDQKKILKLINKELNYDDSVFKINSILSYISSIKNDFGYYLDEDTKAIYDEYFELYKKHLKNNNSVDFDDLIILCNELFKNHPHILEKWRYRYHYLHVDEFQDTNHSQYQLVKYLGKDLNVFVVGDPDQNIYSWRGAQIDFIINFENDFKPAKIIKLEYNYRSSKHILDVANSLIKNNSNRIDKVLKATIDEEDLKVEQFVGRHDYNEAEYVINKILTLTNNDDHINYQDFAILYRANYISRVFEQELLKHDIPYQVIGGIRFFDRKEIKDLIAYLKVIDSFDNLSLLRIINVPKRKIGDRSIDKLIAYANNHNLSYFNVLENHLDELKLSNTQNINIMTFIKDIKIWQEQALMVPDLMIAITAKYDLISDFQVSSNEYQSKAENLEEIINYAKSTSYNLGEFLQAISLETSYEDQSDNDKVNLMSIHSAKGLEFKYVFACFLCDGIFPSRFALDKDDLEEERRLAYVCFTRAKKQLFISSHTAGYNFQRMSSSIFIKEIDDHLLDKYGNYLHDSYLVPEISEEQMIVNQNIDTDYQVGEIVMHPKYKKGVIISINDVVLTIAFEHPIGVKTINGNFVRKV
ncbi:MAG: UvrD-helicase domain-containing protein [Bacilli bacterium]|jgi:DNA helicase-2/ATP-dependent DNA helicase PcrA|nr:UvrD-helicase domain-containing protein [Bacilli bacterium]